MLKFEFTLFDIVKRTGIKRETLNDWKVKGYIKTSRTKPISRGDKAFFDFWGLNGIILFRRLLKQGISRKVAAEIVESIEPLKIHSPTDEYKTYEFLGVVRTKRGKMVAQFFRQNAPVDLSVIHRIDDLDHMYVWNYKEVIKEVRAAIF